MPGSTLEAKVSKAYVWTTAGNVAKTGAGFAISLVLAHLLGPADYGLLGMAMVFTNILMMLQDCGIGQAVVYYQEERSGLPLYFTAAAMIGVVLSAIAFVVAPLIAWFYHQPAITPVVRVLGSTLVLGSLYSVAQGQLVREFDFRRLAIIELASTAIAGVTGIVCALMGFGVWALVVNVVFSGLMQTGAVCWLVRPSFTTRIDFAKLKAILRWGLPLTGASVLWQFYENSDYLVVGKLLGDAAVGYYTMAFRTATLVNSRVASIINKVSFPTFSAVQSDYPKLIEYWNSITRTLGLLIFPLSTIVAMNAHDFLLIVGEKWLPAEVPLQLLCILGCMKPLVSTMGNCMSAVGRTDLGFRLNLTNAICLPLSFIVACKVGGVVGVAIAWCVVAPIIFAVFLVKTIRYVRGSVREYAATLKPGIAISIGCAVVMYLAGMAFQPGIVRLIVRGIAGGLAILAGYWFDEPTRTAIRGYLRRSPAPAVQMAQSPVDV